jgi:outer membrane lipoprotein-sorting protein
MMRVAIALALIAVTGVAHADMDAADVLQRVEQTYKEHPHLTAGFDYTNTNAMTGKVSKSAGTLFVAKPDKIRFEYVKTKNGKSTIDVIHLFDGKTGWYIDHGGLQFAKLQTDASQLPAAVAFFLGGGGLSKEFTPAFAKAGDGTNILLELTPKKPSAAYAKITLTVDNRGMRVSKTKITNSSGDTGEFVFSNLTTNKPPPAGTFVVDKKQIAGYKEVKR